MMNARKAREKLHSIYAQFLEDESLSNRLLSLVSAASTGAGTVIGLVDELNELLSTQMNYSLNDSPGFDYCYIQLIIFAAFIASLISGHTFFKNRFSYKNIFEGVTKGVSEESAEELTKNTETFIEDIDDLLIELKLPYHLASNETQGSVKLKRGKKDKKRKAQDAEDITTQNTFKNRLKKFYENYVYRPSAWIAEVFLLPIFRALNISVSTHKLALSISILFAILITGGTATSVLAAMAGTATLSTATLGLVLVVPLAIGGLYLALNYSSEIWKTSKRFFSTGKLFAEPDELSKQEEKELVKELAKNMAIKTERYHLAEEHGHATRAKRSRIREFTEKYRDRSLKSKGFKTYHPIKISMEESFDEQAEKPIGLWGNIKYYYHKSKSWLDNSTARIIFSGLNNFVSSFIISSSIFWFLAFVVSAILLAAGISLSGSVYAAPAGIVLAGIGVGVLVAAVVGSVYLVKTYLDEKKHQYAMKESPELEPDSLKHREKNIAQREKNIEYELLKLKYKVEKYNAYVDHYNQHAKKGEEMEKMDIYDLQTTFDIKSFKKETPVFQDGGFKSPWFIEQPLTFLRSFSSGTSLAKNALYILAIASVAFTTGPVAIPILVTFGVAWAAVSFIGRAIHRDNEAYRKKLATENFELTQKEALLDKVEHDIEGLSDEISLANACFDDWSNGEEIPKEPIKELSNKKLLKSEVLPGHNPESLFDHHHDARERMIHEKKLAVEILAETNDESTEKLQQSEH